MDFPSSWEGYGWLAPQDHSEGTEAGKEEASEGSLDYHCVPLLSAPITGSPVPSHLRTCCHHSPPVTASGGGREGRDGKEEAGEDLEEASMPGQFHWLKEVMLTSVKIFLNVPISRVLMQDLQELVGYQDTTDQMDSLVPRAQKAKKEQMEKEEKWVFCHSSNSFPCFLSPLLHFG